MKGLIPPKPYKTIHFDYDKMTASDYEFAMEFIDLNFEDFTDEVTLEYKAWKFVLS